MSWSEFSDGRHILGAVFPDFAQRVAEERLWQFRSPMRGYRAYQLPHLRDELRSSFEAELQRKPSIEIGLARGPQSCPQFHGELSPSAFTRMSYRMRFTSEETGTRFRGRGLGSQRRLWSCQGTATLTRDKRRTCALRSSKCISRIESTAGIQLLLRQHCQISHAVRNLLQESLQLQPSAFFLRELGFFVTSTRHSKFCSRSAA